MAFLSRLFNRGPDAFQAAREQAYRQGMRDARQHALREFTDPDFQPVYVSEIRAGSRERIAHLDMELAATRTELLRRAGEARETILRETGRADLYGEPAPSAAQNGHHAAGPDPFISVAEARLRRELRRRHTAMREANDMGYECLLLTDCTGATDVGNYEAALKMVTMQGGVFGAIAPSSALLAALGG